MLALLRPPFTPISNCVERLGVRRAKQGSVTNWARQRERWVGCVFDWSEVDQIGSEWRKFIRVLRLLTSSSQWSGVFLHWKCMKTNRTFLFTAGNNSTFNPIHIVRHRRAASSHFGNTWKARDICDSHIHGDIIILYSYVHNRNKVSDPTQTRTQNQQQQHERNEGVITSISDHSVNVALDSPLDDEENDSNSHQQYAIIKSTSDVTHKCYMDALNLLQKVADNPSHPCYRLLNILLNEGDHVLPKFNKNNIVNFGRVIEWGTTGRNWFVSTCKRSCSHSWATRDWKDTQHDIVNSEIIVSGWRESS